MIAAHQLRASRSRIASASLRSTLVAPRRANSRMARRFCQSAARAGARPRRAQPPVRAGREAAERAAARSAMRASSSTGWPTASHMRRTWRLRPSWIVSSISPAPSRRTRAGAVGPSSSSTPSRSARSAPLADGPAADPRAVGLRHLVAGVREPVGELAVVGQQDQPGRCRRRGARPGRGAGPAADQLDDGRAAVRVARGRDDADAACSARTTTRGSGPASGARRRRRHALVLVDVAGGVGHDARRRPSRARRRSAPRPRAARRRRRGPGTCASRIPRSIGCNHRTRDRRAWTSSCSTSTLADARRARLPRPPGVGVGWRAAPRGYEEMTDLPAALRAALAERGAVLDARSCASEAVRATAPSRRCSRPPTGARSRRC